MSVSEGQQVGNYRVLSRIGTGGMGAVYLAEHPVIGKRVALKVIHRELASNREVISRFYQEARAVTKIGNEHIVEIHDFGQSPEGDHFFIMEYLEGQTLAQVLMQERVLPVDRALHICAQVADALIAAHNAGIIHRDLKPDNVMLCRRLGDPYFVKLLDFGLAKMYDGGARNLTAQGVVLGTPQYMSPEACESKKNVDHRTDIYALGVLLFQMLTGQVPFDGGTMGEVLIKQVMHAPPAPRALNPHIPPSVEQIILRCLAKQADARFPTMLALRDAILDPERYLATSPPMMPAAMPTQAAMAATMYGASGAAGPGGPAGAATSMPLALKAPPTPVSDAKTMMNDAALGVARTEGIDISGAMAPPPGLARRTTAVPGMPAPAPLQNQTMVIATPPGFKTHPPRRALPWVIVGLVVVGVVGAIVAVLLLTGGGSSQGSGGTAVAAGTGAGTEGGDGSGAAGGTAAGPGSSDGSGAAAGTGSSDGSGAAAGTGSSEGSGAAAGTGSAEGSGAAVGTGSGAAAAVDAGVAEAIDAGPPVDAAAPRMARLTITSEPSGASVYDEAGHKLGVTPTEVAVPADGTQLELTLRHPKTRERKKTVMATGDMTISVILEKLPRHGGGRRGGGSHGGRRGSGSGSGSGSNGTGIMEPDI